MALTASEAFKFGFLARCACSGLSPSEILPHAEKAAAYLEKSAFLGTLVDKGLDAAKSVLGGAVNYGVPLALLAPPVAGGLAGYGLARATDINDRDVADVKNDELIDEYQRQTAKLQRQKLLREVLHRPRRSVRPLM